MSDKPIDKNVEGQSPLGRVVNPKNLKATLIIGNKDGQVSYRKEGSLFDLKIENNQSLPGLPNPEWHWASFQHHWGCDIFNSCRSFIHWRAYCTDQRDGTKINWDVVEVAALNSNGSFDQNSIGQQPFYQHYQNNISDFGVGWDKEGKDYDFYTGAKCWIGTMWWFWSFRSHAS